MRRTYSEETGKGREERLYSDVPDLVHGIDDGHVMLSVVIDAIAIEGDACRADAWDAC